MRAAVVTIYTCVTDTNAGADVMKLPIFCLLTVVSICSLALSCQAQDVENSSLPTRYYVEAKLDRSSYEVFYLGAANRGSTSPWAVNIGKQLTSRWALQLGYAYFHDGYYRNPEYTLTTVTGQHVYGWRSSDTWIHTIPLAVRYAIISQPQSHLQVDVLGGSTWLNARVEQAGEEFIDGQSQGRLSNEFRTTQLYITLGLQTRYTFSRHLGGMINYALIRNTKSVPEYVHLSLAGNKWGITRSISIGVSYLFNVRKSAE